MKYYLALSLWSFSFFSFGQLKKVCNLPEVLNECSGMIFLNDSTLIMHNDSEFPNKLYQVSTTGKIEKSISLATKLIDFEAITRHENILYLGDIGNNLNQRRDMKIVQVDLNSKKEQINSIIYPNQLAFPPSKDSLYFDAEAMVYSHDSLFIFTKNRTKPFDGKSLVYSLDLQTDKLNFYTTLPLGKGFWFTKSITDVCMFKNHFFVLTYHNLYVYNSQFELIKKHHFGHIAQREAIAINSKGEIYIATEKHRFLGGGKMYKLKLKWEKR